MKASPVSVYLRDASWWNSPDRHTPKRYHRPSTTPGNECMAACAPTRIMLDENSSSLSTRVAADLLCLRCFDVNGSPRDDVNASPTDDTLPCG